MALCNSRKLHVRIFYGPDCSPFVLPVQFCKIVLIKMAYDYEVTRKLYLKKQCLLSYRWWGTSYWSLSGYMHILFLFSLLSIVWWEEIHFYSGFLNAMSAIFPLQIFGLNKSSNQFLQMSCCSHKESDYDLQRHQRNSGSPIATSLARFHYIINSFDPNPRRLKCNRISSFES